MAEVPDLDAKRRQRHAEREQEFGEKPFKFGGEIFYVRPVARYEALKRVALLDESSSGNETFDAIEQSVFSMIDPKDDARERFLRVIRSDEDPVTFEDLIDLQQWLLQEQTGRPPTREQPSSSTPSEAGPHLTAVSSSEQDAASTI